VNVFVHLFQLLLASGVHGFPVGADLGDRVEVSAFRAGEAVRDTAVAHESGFVVHSRAALDEVVRT